MKIFSLIIGLIIFLLSFWGFYFKSSHSAQSISNYQKVNLKKDTCYYYLSGSGMTGGLTVLDIVPFDCQAKYDTIGKLLNQTLKTKYPDSYYQLENRKINGPFKSLKEAQNSILEQIKNFNIHK